MVRVGLAAEPLKLRTPLAEALSVARMVKA